MAVSCRPIHPGQECWPYRYTCYRSSAACPRQSPWIHDLEKLSATLITALSVVLLLFTLRRLTNEKVAWYIAIVYAFGYQQLQQQQSGIMAAWAESALPDPDDLLAGQRHRRAEILRLCRVGAGQRDHLSPVERHSWRSRLRHMCS